MLIQSQTYSGGDTSGPRQR